MRIRNLVDWQSCRECLLSFPHCTPFGCVGGAPHHRLSKIRHPNGDISNITQCATNVKSWGIRNVLCQKDTRYPTPPTPIFLAGGWKLTCQEILQILEIARAGGTPEHARPVIQICIRGRYARVTILPIDISAPDIYIGTEQMKPIHMERIIYYGGFGA